MAANRAGLTQALGMTKQKSGNRLPESLLAAHRNLLAVQWQRLTTPDLWRHLYLIVGAEHQRYSKSIEGIRYFGDPRLQPQLRWRRLAIAQELNDRGLELNPVLFQYALPHRQWPGLAQLLGKKPSQTGSHA